MEINKSNYKSINKSNMSTNKSTEKMESSTTFFGQASVLFTFHLLNKVMEVVNTADPKLDYYKIPFYNYHEVFAVKFGTDETSPVKKYHIHKLIYGPTKTVKGKEDFNLRTDDEDFWGKQWGFEYSPFRMAQKVLKDFGLYLVDHTFSGETPFFYLYKYLPKRGVIDKTPWHDYCNVPALCQKDFDSKKLSHEDTISSASNAWDKFNTMCKKEGHVIDKIFFMVEADTAPKKKIYIKKKSEDTKTPANTTTNSSDAETNPEEKSSTNKTYAQVANTNA
jgi:hypothetical protein